MITTLEIRWFFAGPAPQEVVAWPGPSSTPPVTFLARTDYYLPLPAQNDLGVKWREGWLEIKHRLELDRSLSLARAMVGHVARWRKWSFQLPGSTPDQPPPEIRQNWLAVTKRRTLWRIGWTDREIASASGAASTVPGGHLELAYLRLRGQEAWTVGLELYGQENLSLDSLRRLARKVLVSDSTPLPLPELTQRDSFAYPTWLARRLSRPAQSQGGGS